MKRDAFSNKVSLLMREGYPQKQALAIAFSYKRKNKLATGGRFKKPESSTNTLPRGYQGVRTTGEPYGETMFPFMGAEDDRVNWMHPLGMENHAENKISLANSLRKRKPEKAARLEREATEIYNYLQTRPKMGGKYVDVDAISYANGGEFGDPEISEYDKRHTYNTMLPGIRMEMFNRWLMDESKKQQRPISMDLDSYDVMGFYDAGEQVDERGHGTDYFKKPYHPTFSNQSKYHGVDGYEGGEWAEDRFIASPTNRRFARPKDMLYQMQADEGMGLQYDENEFYTQDDLKQLGGKFNPDEPPVARRDATYVDQVMPLNETYIPYEEPKPWEGMMTPPGELKQGSNTFADRAIDAFRTKVPESWRMVMPGFSDAEDIAYFTNAWSEKGHPGHKALSAGFLGLPIVGSGLAKKFMKKGAKAGLEAGEQAAHDVRIGSSDIIRNANNDFFTEAEEAIPTRQGEGLAGEPEPFNDVLYQENDFPDLGMTEEQIGNLRQATREPRTTDQLNQMTLSERRNAFGVEDENDHLDALLTAHRNASQGNPSMQDLELLNSPEGQYMQTVMDEGSGGILARSQVRDYLRRAGEMENLRNTPDLSETELRNMTHRERLNSLNTESYEFKRKLQDYISRPEAYVDDPIMQRYLKTPEGARVNKLISAKTDPGDIRYNLHYFLEELRDAETALNDARPQIKNLMDGLSANNTAHTERALNSMKAQFNDWNRNIAYMYGDILHAEGLVPANASNDVIKQGLEKVIDNPTSVKSKNVLRKLSDISQGDFKSANNDLVTGAERRADLELDVRQKSRIEHGKVENLKGVIGTDNLELGKWKLTGREGVDIDFKLNKSKPDGDVYEFTAKTPHSSINGTLKRNAEGGYDIGIGLFSVNNIETMYRRVEKGKNKGKLFLDKKVTNNNVKILSELIDAAPGNTSLKVSSVSTDSTPLIYAMLARKGEKGKFKFMYNEADNIAALNKGKDDVRLKRGLNELGQFSSISESSGIDLYGDRPRFDSKKFNPDKFINDLNKIIDNYNEINADNIPHAKWDDNFDSLLKDYREQIKNNVPLNERQEFSQDQILDNVKFPAINLKKMFMAMIGAGYFGKTVVKGQEEDPEMAEQFAYGGEAFGANDYYTMEDLYSQYGRGGKAGFLRSNIGNIAKVVLGTAGSIAFPAAAPYLAPMAISGGMDMGRDLTSEEEEPYMAPVSKERQIYQGLRAMGGKFKRHDYEGMPHEMGGIKMPGPGVEVEDNETRFNDTILSDRIKLTKDMYNKYKGVIPGLSKSDIGRSMADIGKSKDNRFKQREGDLWNDEAREMFNLPIQMVSQELADEMEGQMLPMNQGPYKRAAFGDVFRTVGEQFKGDPLGTAPIAANLVGAGITALTPTEKVGYRPARFSPTKVTPISTRTGENAIRRAGQNYRARYNRLNPRMLMTNAQGFFATEAEQIGDLQENIAAQNAQMVSEANSRDAYSRNRLNQYNSQLATSVDQMNAQNRAAKMNALSAQMGKFTEGLSQRASDIKRTEYQDKHNQEMMDFYREIYGLKDNQSPMPYMSDLESQSPIYSGEDVISEPDVAVEPWMTGPFNSGYNEPDIPVEPWMTKPFTAGSNRLSSLSGYGRYCGGGKFKRRK